MSAESSVRSRARSCVAALLIGLVSVPVGSALQPAPAHASTSSQAVLDEAAKHFGKPYSWGATGPDSFDCSGFVGYVFRQLGVELPRTSRDQYNAVQHVAQDQKQPGDLIFTYDSGGIYHVGIYAGGNQAWAATKTGDVVRPQNLWTSSYYVGRVAGVGPRVAGAIGGKWEELGGERGFLGQPLNAEHAVPAARKVDFQGGDIYWSPATGAREVHGGIAAKYEQTGASAGPLGLPTSDEHDARGGRLNRFTGGAVYAGPTGTFEVHGGIAGKYDLLGGASGVLGLPTSDEHDAAGGGRLNRFAGGAIYWGPQGGFAVHGGIVAKYDSLGGAAGFLGKPVSDEHDVPGGRANRFEGGAIYWGPRGGFEVHGAIAAKYDELGGPGSRLGLPVSDEQAVAGGFESRFEHGVLRHDSSTGRTAVATP